MPHTSDDPQAALERALRRLPGWWIEGPVQAADGSWTAWGVAGGSTRAWVAARGSDEQTARVALADRLARLGWPWRRRTYLPIAATVVPLLGEVPFLLAGGDIEGFGSLFFLCLAAVGFVPVLLDGARGVLWGLGAFGIEFAVIWWLINASAEDCASSAGCFENYGPIFLGLLVIVAAALAVVGALVGGGARVIAKWHLRPQQWEWVPRWGPPAHR